MPDLRKPKQKNVSKKHNKRVPMKTIQHVGLMVALLLAAAPQAGMSTVFFTDTFGTSSLDQLSVPGGTPTASSTSYDIASTKSPTQTPTIGPNLLSLHLDAQTSSAYVELQALFTTNPVALVAAGDYIALAVTFTNSSNSLMQSTGSPVWIGLYNSGSSPGNENYPVPGGLTNAGLGAGTTYAFGYCQNWVGYEGQMENTNTSVIVTRAAQTLTSQRNQDLLGNGISSTSADTAGTTLATSASSSFAFLTNVPYTAYLSIQLDPVGSGDYIIQNVLFQGAGTNNPYVISNEVTASSATAPLVTSFDGLAFGVDNKTSSSDEFDPDAQISEIQVYGQSTAPTGPPTIPGEPVPALVVSGGSTAFSITAVGEGVSFQWHRNGTNLENAGNISGATSSLLVISPATAADAFSGNAGYYCTVYGAGGYSTNSTTNALTLVPGTNLVWSGNTWDVDNTSAWLTPSDTSSVFIDGDAVTFNGGSTFINMSGPYVAPGSVAITGSDNFTIQGSGVLAGPCTVNFTGTGQLTLDSANAYSGGTIINNPLAYVYLSVYAGLGTGPVTFAAPGAEMEIASAGTATSGVAGGVVINANSTIQVDSDTSEGAVFLGDFSGTSGSTLTFVPDPSPAFTTTSRMRAYGQNTTCAAGLDLDSSYFLFAFYEGSGNQTYNGVISGTGAVMNKGGANTTTTLNGQNTFSGGTYVPAGSLGIGASSVPTSGTVTSSPLGTGPLYLAVDSTTGNTANAQIFASGGAWTIANPIQYPTGTNNLTLTIGGTYPLIFTGGYALNGQDNATTFLNRYLTVTNTNALTTIGGVVSDGGLGCSLNFVGPGILSLTGAETYTGVTTISNGTLDVDGSLAAASSVTVSNGGVLAGVGTVNGTVTVESGGGIAAGDQAIGKLTINNSLTLDAGSSNAIKVSVTGGTHDTVAANSIAYNGNLFVTNLAGTPTTSTTFTIFSASSHTGNFTSISGSPGAGLGWSFNPTTGVLSVVSVVNTTPTNISYSVTTTASATNLALSWPADHTGWTLQSQTNLWNTNWVNVAGSAATNQVIIPINPAIPDIFYRLVYPK
jgi:autotransporter-associated beta strand protein